jgi:hypothetical protein
MSESSEVATTPMTPSAPHEALGFFEGTWTVEESAPERRFVETCTWLDGGRRHMICRSTWQTVSGPREGMSIFSFRAEDSTYLYYGLRADGAVEALQGRCLPDGWEFSREEGVGANRQRSRVTIARLTQNRFRFVVESAEGDGPWILEDTVHYRMVDAPKS